MPVVSLRQLGLEPRAELVDARQQLLRFVEYDCAEAAGDGVAAERRAVMSRLHDAFERCAGEHGAERQSAAERLRQRDDVRHDAALLKREERTGAPEAALDLVEHEQRAGRVGDAPRGDEVRRR